MSFLDFLFIPIGCRCMREDVSQVKRKDAAEYFADTLRDLLDIQQCSPNSIPWNMSAETKTE